MTNTSKKAPEARVESAVRAEGFAEYPKMLYFKGDATNYRTVASEAEEAEAGADWGADIIAPAAK